MTRPIWDSPELSTPWDDGEERAEGDDVDDV